MDEWNGSFEPEQGEKRKDDAGAGQGAPGYGQEGYAQSIDFGGGGQGEPGGPDRDSKDSNSKSGNYRSSYDSYRFREPTGTPDGPEPPNRDNDRLKKLLLGAAVALAGVLLLLVVINAVSRIARGVGGSDSAAAKAESGIALGSGSLDQSDKMDEDEAGAAERELPSSGDDGKDDLLTAGNSESASGDLESVSGDSVIASGDPESTSKDSENASGDLESASVPSEAGDELTVVQVVRKVMPSMVSITNISEKEYRTFFGDTVQRDEVSAASGIIVAQIDNALLIATNDHVISEARDITVAFYDETTAQGSVIGADADNDLAIVQVNLDDVSEETQAVIRVVDIGDSDALEVGEPVVAIGNALGYGQSVSSGIVSALNRVVKDSDGTIRSVIQTDASINPGNSGGALINMRGELVGINEAKLVNTSVEGVGYAIPMAIAEPILSRLGSGTAREPVSEDEASYLGITCVTLPSYYTQMGYPAGVYVAEVVEGGPADQAGLQREDIITAMDGNSVTTQEQLLRQLTYFAAGEELKLSVSRLSDDEDGFEKIYLTVELGSRAQAVKGGLIEAAPEPDDIEEEEMTAESTPLMSPPEERADEDAEAENAGGAEGDDAIDRDYGGLFGDDDYGIYDFFR